MYRSFRLVHQRGWLRSGSREEVKPDNAPERRKPVAPCNLLALFVTAARVRYRHLINTPFGFRDFRRDFRLEAETIRLQPNALQDFAAKTL